jgi:hypothetical protein
MLRLIILNNSRFKIAKRTLIILLLFQIIRLIDVGVYHEYLLAQKKGIEISEYEMAMQLIVYGLSYFLLNLCRFIALIMVILWLKRAYMNLRAIHMSLKYNDWWVIWGWFAPIFSYFRPLQIFKELFRKTKSSLDEKDPEEAAKLAGLPLGLWWGLGYFGLFLEYMGLSTFQQTEYLQFEINGNVISLLAAILNGIVLLLFLKIINRYHEGEIVLYAHLTQEDQEPDSLNRNP